MIDLTDSAANKMKELLDDSENAGIRVGVLGGGCSGLQYKLEMSSSPLEDDKIITVKEVDLFLRASCMRK